MKTLTIRPITVDELEQADNVIEMLAEYAVESSIRGLGQIDVQFDLYRTLENVKAFHMLGAYRANALVGFISFVVSKQPHYGSVTATSESFFVAQSERAGGAGLKLLRAAQDKARERGAIGMLVSSPAGGRLARVLPRLGFAHTNEVFFKELQ